MDLSARLKWAVMGLSTGIVVVGGSSLSIHRFGFAMSRSDIPTYATLRTIRRTRNPKGVSERAQRGDRSRPVPASSTSTPRGAWRLHRPRRDFVTHFGGIATASIG